MHLLQCSDQRSIVYYRLVVGTVSRLLYDNPHQKQGGKILNDWKPPVCQESGDTGGHVHVYFSSNTGAISPQGLRTPITQGFRGIQSVD